MGGDPHGDVLVAVFAAPARTASSAPRSRSIAARRDIGCACPRRATAFAWRVAARHRRRRRAPTPRPTLADRVADRGALDADPRRGAGARRGAPRGPPTAPRSTRSPTPRASPREWWEVSGKRTIVSPHTKLALLDAMRLPARSEAQARDVAGAPGGGNARAPNSALADADARRSRASRRCASPSAKPARTSDYASCSRTATRVEGRAELGEGAGADAAPTAAKSPSAISRCPNCRSAAIGSKSRRRVRADDRAAECFSPKALWRRRFGVGRAALRAATPQRRPGHRRLRRARRWRARRRARRGAAISAYRRCTRCSRTTAAARAPITPPTGASSIRC